MEDNRVGGLIILDKKLLLVSMPDNPYFWTPGGRVKVGETLEQALARELYEELRVTIDSYSLMLIENYKTSDTNSYSYVVTTHDIPRASHEINRIRWFKKSELCGPDNELTKSVSAALINKLSAADML